MPDTALKKKEKLVEVNAEDLKIGMYASALDRPWLESSFLFQGFLITDPMETLSAGGKLDVKTAQKAIQPIVEMDVTSEYTNEVLFIDKGLEPGAFGIDPAEYFFE